MKKLILIFITLVLGATAQDVYRLNDSTFVYPCIHSDSTTSYNFVGLPLETGWTMASDLDSLGMNIDTISRLNVEMGKWETAAYHSAFGWIKDFPVETGGSYLISAKNDFDFIVTGDSVSVSYDFYNGKFTPITMPLEKEYMTLASNIYADTGGKVPAVYRYLNDQQIWNGALRTAFGTWSNNFAIEPAMPLSLWSTGDFSWPTYKNSIDVSGLTDPNSPKGLSGGGPRMVFVHLIHEHVRELTEDEMKLIQFKAWFSERPDLILDENSYDCGFMHINGMSVMYVNLGSFQFEWSAGEEFSIESVNFYDMMGFGYWSSMDNSSSAIFHGFEDIPGSGKPSVVFMNSIIPLIGVDVTVREESGNIVLEWGWAGEDVTGYNIYTSDEPYGTFSYVTTTTSLSWSTPASENKKFFYVASTNAKSSETPKTIIVNEKR